MSILCLTSSLLTINLVSADSNFSNKQTIQQKIENMKADGLSQQDAEYYANFDDKVKQMEANKEEFKLDSNTPDLSDADVAKDVKKNRDNILQGDKAAIKQGLKSIARLHDKNTTAEMDSLMNQHQGQQEYVIQYPDGSKLSVKQHLAEKVKDGNVYPSGYTEATMFSRHDYTSNGTYNNGYNEWSFITGVNYSKIRITFSFTLTNYSNPGTVNMTYAMGAQSSYGVVGIANSNGGAISRAQNVQPSTPAEANTQVIFNVSGSFSASYLALSIGVTLGASWTQYVYERLYGDGMSWGVAATYL